MTVIGSDQVRAEILDHVGAELSAKGILKSEAPADLDLLGEGLIDSFGIIELMSMLEERFAVELDFDDLDPEVVTVLGPLSEYVARLAAHRG